MKKKIKMKIVTEEIPSKGREHQRIMAGAEEVLKIKGVMIMKNEACIVGYIK